MVPLLEACAAEPRPELVWQIDHGLVYCYDTLAEPDCYGAPRPDDGGRLIAVGPRLTYLPRWELNPD